MCEHRYENSYNKPDPAERLARLVERDMGGNVDAKKLALFLRRRWSRVQALAHQIHESDSC